jgi:hypothetical protein
MQLFTILLSALALAASTTTANPIAAPQEHLSELLILYPAGGEFWPSGSSQTVMWNTSEIPLEDYNLTGKLFLGNDGTGFEIISCKLLPNLLCFTVVVTQQYLSFTCTCNPLYSQPACNRLFAGEWVRNLPRAKRGIFPRLFCCS